MTVMRLRFAVAITNKANIRTAVMIREGGKAAAHIMSDSIKNTVQTKLESTDLVRWASKFWYQSTDKPLVCSNVYLFSQYDAALWNIDQKTDGSTDLHHTTKPPNMEEKKNIGHWV